MHYGMDYHLQHPRDRGSTNKDVLADNGGPPTYLDITYSSQPRTRLYYAKSDLPPTLTVQLSQLVCELSSIEKPLRLCEGCQHDGGPRNSALQISCKRRLGLGLLTVHGQRVSGSPYVKFTSDNQLLNSPLSTIALHRGFLKSFE